MVYPPYAAPFPDTQGRTDITLGTQQRAMLTLMAQKPGHVFTTRGARRQARACRR